MRSTNVLSALPLLVFLAASACDKGSSEGPATTTPSATASAAAQAATSAPAAASSTPRNAERGPGHGGIDAMFFRAALDLTLSDATKAKIEALQSGLHDRETGPREATKTFNADLVAQVRAAKIDPAKLQGDEAALDAAMKVAHDKQAAALDGLHAALDPTQRKAVIDAVRAKHAAHEHPMPDGGAADWSKRHLEKITKDLDLDAGQQTKVAALVAKEGGPAAMQAMHDAMKTQFEALLTAFQADTFDASKAVPLTMGGKTPHDGMERQVTFMTGLLPLLHPDQREKLAVSLEKGRASHGMGGPEDDDEGHGKGGGGGE